MDLGDINHMIQSTDILKNISHLKGSDSVIVGNGAKLQIIHIWNASIG